MGSSGMSTGDRFKTGPPDEIASLAREAKECGFVLKLALLTKQVCEISNGVEDPRLRPLLEILAYARSRLSASRQSQGSRKGPISQGPHSATHPNEDQLVQTKAQMEAVRALQKNALLSTDLILACAGASLGAAGDKLLSANSENGTTAEAKQETSAVQGASVKPDGRLSSPRTERTVIPLASARKSPPRLYGHAAGGKKKNQQSIAKAVPNMMLAGQVNGTSNADLSSRTPARKANQNAATSAPAVPPGAKLGSVESSPKLSVKRITDQSDALGSKSIKRVKKQVASDRGDQYFGQMSTGVGLEASSVSRDMLEDSDNVRDSDVEVDSVDEEPDGPPLIDISEAIRNAATEEDDSLELKPLITGTPDDKDEVEDSTARDRTPEDAVEHRDDLREKKELSYERIVRERERRLNKRLTSRMMELHKIPVLLSESIRRQATLELKKLELVGLQRIVRKQAVLELHRLMSPMWTKRRLEMGTCYQRQNPSDDGETGGEKDLASQRTRQRREKRTRQRSRLKSYLSNLTLHATDFRKHHIAVQGSLQRTVDGVRRHFLMRARVEERARKREDTERLKALKENDEEAYLRLVQNTKNERLLTFLRQTDRYLSEIGAQVEKQKGGSGPAPGEQQTGASSHDDAMVDDYSVIGSSNTLEAMRKRREEYYSLTHTVREDVKQPSCLVGGSLKPYQLEGLGWLVSLYNNNLNGILADEMGLGKTIQTISLLAYLKEFKDNSGPFLIVVPLATVSNWVRELEAWLPSSRKVVYRGDRNTRKQIQQHEMAQADFSVILTTYEMVIKDKSILTKWRWKYIIVDEGHRMKNADCKLALTLSTYETKNRLLLTGTPLQNNLTELWALLNFLLPSIFSSSVTFQQWFSSPFQANNMGDQPDVTGEEQLLIINRLHQVLRPFLLRRLKADVESQLPEKIERLIPCELSVWQKVLYRQIQNRLAVSAGDEEKTRSFNNVVMQLKKICNHPYLFYDYHIIDTLPDEFLVRTSGKFELLDRILPKLLRTGHKTLIFSQMTHALDILEVFLARAGFRFLRMDGMTKAEDRQEMLELFNAEGSEYFCFLLSTRAGGLGLNLQSADTVIIFDSDWNPMMDLQAQDRVHRIGQTREVRVFRLICSNTVENKILEQANRKLEMDAQIIQAGQFNNKTTERERQKMLRNYILSKKPEGDEVMESIPDDEAINRMMVRNMEELEVMQAMDRERELEEKESGIPRSLMRAEVELPSWVLAPEEEKGQKVEVEEEVHGRGRRRKKNVLYSEHMDIDELLREESGRTRKRRSNAKQSSKLPENGRPLSASGTELPTPGESGERSGNEGTDQGATQPPNSPQGEAPDEKPRDLASPESVDPAPPQSGLNSVSSAVGQ
eukprot:CAMPEP_0184753468 /NCGR_PEP_ID=MMETSP0315-20130426/44112_1 /TAXON_ID=101924 /ORGANISM="Rhodosorus marinus, Strain UTEX LB 2760" /LENGTH=1366 /DNA_ID=CAMNT_0027232845 /DNA_START=1109 /DNA_END=5209 /DNA_ORIENTATION=-